MVVVNMHDAKRQLSRLIKRVLAGGEVIIARRGEPLVRLVSAQDLDVKRSLGGVSVQMSDDFDAPLDDFDGYQ